MWLHFKTTLYTHSRVLQQLVWIKSNKFQMLPELHGHVTRKAIQVQVDIKIWKQIISLNITMAIYPFIQARNCNGELLANSQVQIFAIIVHLPLDVSFDHDMVQYVVTKLENETCDFVSQSRTKCRTSPNQADSFLELTLDTYFKNSSLVMTDFLTLSCARDFLVSISRLVQTAFVTVPVFLTDTKKLADDVNSLHLLFGLAAAFLIRLYKAGCFFRVFWLTHSFKGWPMAAS